MSGKLLTMVVVVLCVAIVGYALWTRSRNTRHIRQFWSPAGAYTIQNGASVKFRRAPFHEIATTGDGQMRDVSAAGGLIHLRATLVDDRYFQWFSRTFFLEKELGGKILCHFVFSRQDRKTELWLDEREGEVYSPLTGQRVHLIPASQKALAVFLSQL